jgi:1-deoxyxylulose-5-phosphate synthase
MRYRRLGSTGTQVSAICLGAMSFGRIESRPWALDEEASREIIRQALDNGVNFIDTANVYNEGASEEIVGRALRDFVRRDDVVLATKVFSRMRPGPNGAGLSRKAILSEIDHSLTRLGVDYVDLYQIHRWDPATPIEETMEALADVVRAGKARYIGASSMFSWQFAKALFTADAHGWPRFVTMQNHYNLLYREEEREMLPLCADQGIGVLPWSPLARGRLARPWGTQTTRSDTDEFGKKLYVEGDEQVVDAVNKVASRRGVPPAQIALAWLMGDTRVTAPIVGVTKPQHLTDALGAVDLTLDDAEVAELTAAYRPHEVSGF